jgi:hypothetical protein
VKPALVAVVWPLTRSRSCVYVRCVVLLVVELWSSHPVERAGLLTFGQQVGRSAPIRPRPFDTHSDERTQHHTRAHTQDTQVGTHITHTRAAHDDVCVRARRCDDRGCSPAISIRPLTDTRRIAARIDGVDAQRRVVVATSSIVPGEACWIAFRQADNRMLVGVKSHQ